MHLQNLGPALDVGTRHHDLAIETTGTQQRRVEDIRAVGCGDQDNALVRFEPVHLDQQLVEGLLTLVMAPAEPGAAMAADRVDLVDEDDAGRIFLALHEQVANTAGADPDEHFNKVGTGNREERHARLTGNGAPEQGLAGTGRADQQDTFGDPAAESGEFLRVLEEGDDLFQLVLRLVDAGDITEGDPGMRIGKQLGPALAEAHRLAAAGLHLPHEENPDRDQQQDRPPGDQQGKPEAAVLVRLGLDHNPLFAQLGDHVGIIRRVGLELAVVFVDSGYIGPLDGNLLDATLLHCGQKRRVADRLLGLVLLPHHVEKHDHDQTDHEPECEIFIELVHLTP